MPMNAMEFGVADGQKRQSRVTKAKRPTGGDRSSGNETTMFYPRRGSTPSLGGSGDP